MLEGALTLEEADGAVARGASGRGSTASGAGALSPPRRLPLLSRSEGSGKQLNDLGNAGVLVAVVGLVGPTASASGGGGARGGAGAPGASAKRGAVPVVPAADLDDGAEQGAVLGISGVGVLIGVADTLKNLGLVHVLDDDAAHRADDGVQRDVDIGAEGLVGKLGEEFGEERSELCGIQSLVLEPVVDAGNAADTSPEVGMDPPSLSAKTGGKKGLDGDGLEDQSLKLRPDISDRGTDSS